MSISETEQSVWDKGHFRYEYQTINNHRMNVARFVQIWNTISLPSAGVIYLTVISLAVDQRSIPMTLMAPVLSSFFLLYVTSIQREYDRRIIRLYPRIIALELVMSFHYFRNYLRSFDHALSEFVSQVEREFSTVQTPEQFEDFWRKTLTIFSNLEDGMIAQGTRSVGAGSYVRDCAICAFLFVVSFVLLWIVDWA